MARLALTFVIVSHLRQIDCDLAHKESSVRRAS